MRARLAPSPSGDLHLGHARSFLLAWWQARALGGEIVLRMEDLDTERCVAGSEQSILEDLTWLGLDWDGAIVRQSERRHLYDSALQTLGTTGRLYPCVCTRKDLAEAARAPHPGESPASSYPGTCRGLYKDLEHARTLTGKPAAWRFTVPPGERQFEDGCAPPYSEDPCLTSGDFPVTRKDGQPAYQLAVVVDDADQSITHVLRGADLRSSTIRQLLLQEALNLPHPSWFHVPLVVDSSGQRLAKRNPSLTLAALRDHGWTAPQLVHWAATSCGLTGSPTRTARDWIPDFDLNALPPNNVPAPNPSTGKPPA